MDNTLPRGILLDLDDTILSMNAYVDRCWREACARYLDGDGGLSVEQLLVAIDGARKWYWSDAERHRQGRLDLPRARAEVVAAALQDLGRDGSRARQLADWYGEAMDRYMRPFPGAVEAVKAFRERDVRLALVTNGSSEFQRRKIERFGLAPLFDHIVIEGEFGCGKPDGKVFSHALKKLGLDANDAWMIGDDLNRDVAGAQGLGIYGIWLDWEGKGLPAATAVRPDRIVTSLAELL